MRPKESVTSPCWCNTVETGLVLGKLSLISLLNAFLVTLQITLRIHIHHRTWVQNPRQSFCWFSPLSFCEGKRQDFNKKWAYKSFGIYKRKILILVFLSNSFFLGAVLNLPSNYDFPDLRDGKRACSRVSGWVNLRSY